MGKIILALVVALLPTGVAAVEQAAQQPAKLTGPPPPVSSNPCAAYGAGYVKVEGSSTCVKIGGSIRVQAGGARR